MSWESDMQDSGGGCIVCGEDSFHCACIKVLPKKVIVRHLKVKDVNLMHPIEVWVDSKGNLRRDIRVIV